jgi:hypothetical protein
VKGDLCEMKVMCFYPFTNSRQERVKIKQFIKILEIKFKKISGRAENTLLYKQTDFGYNKT